MEVKVENKNTEKAIDAQSSASSHGTPEKSTLDKSSMPFIPVPKLIAALSKSLPRKKISAIKKIQKGFIEKKLSRPQMAQFLRKVVGNDDLIASSIKAYTDEMVMANSMVSAFEKLNFHMK